MLPYQFALTQYGVAGVPGTQNNPKVLNFFQEIGATYINDDETSWCAAFMNWCLKQAGLPYTAQLNARQFLTYGKPTTTPKLGDIVVLWRISRQSAFGHVGFYVSTNPDGSINMLGGNESNQVMIKAYPAYQLLAFRTI